jgi:uncharacterized protein (DUF1501 family)
VSAALDRRQVVLGGLSLAGGVALSGCNRGPLGPRDQGGALILLELFGGVDGLSLVVPHGHDEYYRLRPTVSIAKQDTLAVAEDRGLHPFMDRLHGRFQNGELAIVEGVGYPDPIYSHFRSFEFWHTADERGRASGDGWIGKLREAAWPERDESELLVHLGTEVPYSLECKAHRAVSFSSPKNFSWHGDPTARETFEGAAEMQHEGESVSNQVLAQLRGSLQTSTATAARIRAAEEAYEPTVEYPAEPFAHSLKLIAALLNSDLPTRVYSLSLRNFDTHGAMMKGMHAHLFAKLDKGLDAFMSDIAGTHAGERATVVAFSEFGRRVEENESHGTDHGSAGPMLVLGPKVRGGLYGAHPSLSDLDEGGNLRFNTDFRRVYASVCSDLFGVAPERVMGRHFEPLPLFSV